MKTDKFAAFLITLAMTFAFFFLISRNLAGEESAAQSSSSMFLSKEKDEKLVSSEGKEEEENEDENLAVTKENAAELEEGKSANPDQPNAGPSYTVLESKGPGADGEAGMVPKTMTGEVSAAGPSGVAVIYEVDKKNASSSEIWFPFEGNVKLNGYKTARDIEAGDIVAVAYEEALDKSKRAVKSVTLKQKKAAEQEEIQEETPEEEE